MQLPAAAQSGVILRRSAMSGQEPLVGNAATQSEFAAHGSARSLAVTRGQRV
jgi:hypothetical protein